MLDFPHFGSIDLTLALSVDRMLCRCPERTVEKDGYALSAYAKTLLPLSPLRRMLPGMFYECE